MSLKVWYNCNMAINKNLFEVISPDFFRPLVGDNKEIFIECLLIIYKLYKNETSYQIEKNNVVNVVQAYFENRKEDLSFDDDKSTTYKDSREKANQIITRLKKCGWLEEEIQKNHVVFIQLTENAIPIIESFNKILQDEETEYQGVIYRINAILQNIDKTQKPYEDIILGVKTYTDSLISELKRLHSSIKRKIDKQSKQLRPEQILSEFYDYNSKIVSNAYFRLKTSDNIYTFRNPILKNLERIIITDSILDKAIKGYITVESSKSEIITEYEAKEKILIIVNSLISNFKNLDSIIQAIDEKNTQYINNAVSRAKFMLTSGNNTEGKINEILKSIVKSVEETGDNDIETVLEINQMFRIFPQGYLSNDSLHTIPVIKVLDKIERVDESAFISEEEKQAYIDEIQEKTNVYYSRKQVNTYVDNLLGDNERISIDDIPVNELKDFIRIIYMYVYSDEELNCYFIERSDKRVEKSGHHLNYFELVRRS